MVKKAVRDNVFVLSCLRARARALWGTCRSSSCCSGRIGERRCRKCEINASSNFAGRTMRFIHEFMDSRNKTDGITEECIIYASSSAFAAASLSCCQCHAALPFPLTCHAAPFFPSLAPCTNVFKRVVSNFNACVSMYNSNLL